MNEPRPLYLLSFEPLDIIREFLSEYDYGPPGTRAFYGDMVGRAFGAYIEQTGIDHIAQASPQHVREYLHGESERGLAQWTIAQRYQSLHRFFNWCVEQGYVEENPVSKVRRPRTPRAAVEGFSREELQRMGRVLRDRPGRPAAMIARDYAIYTVLLGTGARASELTHMSLHDIDRQNRRVTLHGKGSRDRRVPIGRTAWKALMGWLRARYRVPASAVWLTLQRREMGYSALEIMVRHLGEFADVDHPTIHRFRHTFATEHYRTHRDIMALKTLLGHAKVETTERYLVALGVEYGTEANYQSPDEWLVE